MEVLKIKIEAQGACGKCRAATQTTEYDICPDLGDDVRTIVDCLTRFFAQGWGLTMQDVETFSALIIDMVNDKRVGISYKCLGTLVRGHSTIRFSIKIVHQ